jgi:ABC-type methionine transport system permease subunit
MPAFINPPPPMASHVSSPPATSFAYAGSFQSITQEYMCESNSMQSVPKLHVVLDLCACTWQALPFVIMMIVVNII